MTPQQVRVLAQYNTEMNDRVASAVAQLPPEEQKRDAGAYFKSVHGTLNHILWADSVWLSRFEGRPFPGGSYGHELASEFAQLCKLRSEMDKRIQSWAGQVSSSWLQGELRFTRGEGDEMSRPAWLLVTHLFNHATHHRGQVTTLLTQAGVDVGVTDLPRIVTG